MMKRKVVILMILLVPYMLKAQTEQFPRMTFGTEWGYVGIFYSGYHYNFFAPEGYREDPRGYGFTYDSNAEVYVHGGYNINVKYNLSIDLGLTAIKDYHHAIPISLRLTRYFGTDPMKDRWFAFVDLGSGLSIKENPQTLLTGKVGAGYRLSLSRNTKLDFHAALRCCLTHPDIQYYGVWIPHESINRNNAYLSALSIGMALTF